jgi:hypothetical protein
MYGTEEFLWGGLRTRLERMGRVRPRTGRSEAGIQRLERMQRQAHPSARGPALRARVHTVGSAQQH